MPRYIDEELLEDDFQEWYKLFTWDDGGVEKSILARVIHKIQDAPTIEPKRKKGKWKPDRDNERDWYCSECDYLGNRWYPYCPNCGACMVKGEKEEL